MKTVKAMLALLLMCFLTFNVVGIGLSPPQLRVIDAPMGVDARVCALRITNTDKDACYIIFKIGCLESDRLNKLRVICNGCHREIGIQRGDLVNGTCPFCGSDDLIFYDIPSDEILNGINLSCYEYPLVFDNVSGTYHTVDKLPSGGVMDIDISVFVPDEPSYYDKHWEARIMATSVENLSRDSFLVYGVENKFLLDTPELPNVEGSSDFSGFMLVGASISSACGAVFVLYVLFKGKKKDDVVLGKKYKNTEKIHLVR